MDPNGTVREYDPEHQDSNASDQTRPTRVNVSEIATTTRDQLDPRPRVMQYFDGEGPTRFQIDLLIAIGTLDRDDQTHEYRRPHGLAIKEFVEEMHDRPINHGRLYPNLDTLVEKGMVRKGKIDRRTNSYRLAPLGEDFLYARISLLANAVLEGPR